MGEKNTSAGDHTEGRMFTKYGSTLRQERSDSHLLIFSL